MFRSDDSSIFVSLDKSFGFCPWPSDMSVWLNPKLVNTSTRLSCFCRCTISWCKVQNCSNYEYTNSADFVCDTVRLQFASTFILCSDRSAYDVKISCGCFEFFVSPTRNLYFLHIYTWHTVVRFEFDRSSELPSLSRYCWCSIVPLRILTFVTFRINAPCSV